MSAPSAAWIEELTRSVSSRLVAEDAALRDTEVVARRRRDALRVFEQSLPPRYRSARFDHPDFRARVSLSMIPTMPPNSSCALFFGPAGAGKTTLSVALFRALLERRIAAASFASDDDIDAVARHCRFVAAYRLGVASLVPGDPQEIKRAMRTPMLLIDDLGRDADIPSNPIAAIVAERHDEERATWITTELAPNEIADRYGGGIARRICENAFVVRFARS